MDKLEAMRMFVRVAEAGGFAEAARQLNVAPPTMTRAVQALEERLRMRLFSRTTRRVRLTEAGERYLHTVRRTLAEIEGVEEDLRQEHAGGIAGTLRLSMPVTLGTRHLVPLLAEFKRQHPNLRMDLDFSDSAVDVVGQGFDAAIRVTTKLSDSALNARRIGTSPVVITASPAYLQRNGTPASLEELGSHQILQYAHKGAYAPGALRIVGLEQPTESPIRTNSGDALKGFAVAGLGLIRTPAFVVADELADGRLARVVPHIGLGEYEISVVFPGRTFMPQRTRRLIDYLAAHLGGLGLPDVDFEAMKAAA